MIAPWAGDRSTAWEPQLPSFPATRWMPSLVTELKIVPTTWNELSMLGPASRTKTRTRPPVGTLIGLSLYWLATPLKTTKSGAGLPAEAFDSEAGWPWGPRYHSLWTIANSASTFGRPSLG